jgi:hypothetical protein
VFGGFHDPDPEFEVRPPSRSLCPTGSAPATAAERRAFSTTPSGSQVLAFREAYLGLLPGTGMRVTWWLVTHGRSATLRIECQDAVNTLGNLDPTSVRPEAWLPGVRTEFAGEATASMPPFKMTLHRAFGDQCSPDLVLDCASATIDVHPAFATLVEGWTTETAVQPASWAPPRTERARVLRCTGAALTDGPACAIPFSKGLAFAAPRPQATTEPARNGVEWAFVNSDEVIQEGGYRWIPDFSLADK